MEFNEFKNHLTFLDMLTMDHIDENEENAI